MLKRMKRVRIYIFLVIVTVIGLVAFGLGSRPMVEGADSSAFSAERVVRDIEQISQKHHSVAHPEERQEVRNYLVDRLNRLGADTIQLYEYKSLVGPENKHVVYTFDATNILAEFYPEGESSDDATTLMFIAHYDSRYSQPMPRQDTVWSYGAADDGYGLGVILESVDQALKYRTDWKQGVKVLFTDAEEVGMMGMKAQWQNNREVFDNVGLIINLEARGPYGPALLFETSPGNARLMELYSSAADYPYTYSLTTVVYGFMPNFTDFTIAKDDIPGLNFSTIADINHYHTDLDNFSNVNPRSIQHYGAQITPIVRRYLTEPQYADRESLKSEEDTICFSLPMLGLLNFSKTTYAIINIVTFALFVLLLAVDRLRGRIEFGSVLRSAGCTLAVALAMLVIGEIVAFAASLIAGAKFNPFGIVQGVAFDNATMIASAVVMTATVVAIYFRQLKRSLLGAQSSIRRSAAESATIRFASDRLYGVLGVMFVLSLVLLLSIGENLMFFIPLFAATIALMLNRLTTLRAWYIAAVALILLHTLSFLYALAMALTIGAFGAVLMLAYLDVRVMLSLSHLYLRK